MKKLLLIFALILPLWLSAQEMPFAVKNKTKFSSSGMIGYETVDSLSYYQARLIQEFKIWKIGVGLDLDFLFDMDYRLRVSDWDHLIDILDKFYYIRYANRKDPYFVHAGGFPDLTVGGGLVMQRYSNMELYSQYRNLGLMIGANLDNVPTQPSFELFSSNLKKNEIISFSSRFKPLPDSTFAVLDQSTIGLSLAWDRDQYGNLRFLEEDSLQSEIKKLKQKPAAVFGIALNMPILQKERFTLGTYSEFAHIGGLGSGAIIPGLFTDFELSKINTAMKVNLEYRRYGRKFSPAFFDQDYEVERGYYDYADSTFHTKRSDVARLGPADGINGMVEANFNKRVKASITWQNIIGKDYDKGKSLWLKLWVDTQWGRLESFSLAYSRTKQSRLSISHFNDPGTKASLAMTFRVSKRWYLIGRYAETYRDKNNDGYVDWLKEAKRSGGVGVKYLH